MGPRPAVIDTNVVVAGVLTADPSSPTARILDGMLEPRLVFLLSLPLLAEYRDVLLRPKVRAIHGLLTDEVDQLLEEIVLNAAIRDPARAGERAPDPGDQHVWDLVASHPAAVLVTGESRLLESPPAERSVLSPCAFLEL